MDSMNPYGLRDGEVSSGVSSSSIFQKYYFTHLLNRFPLVKFIYVRLRLLVFVLMEV